MSKTPAEWATEVVPERGFCACTRYPVEGLSLCLFHQEIAAVVEKATLAERARCAALARAQFGEEYEFSTRRAAALALADRIEAGP